MAIRAGNRPVDDERGAVLVTVAVSMVALLAGAALAIDLGSTLIERRHARNAADHAALAAAWADCNGSNAQNAADASVTRNGYSDTRLTLTKIENGKYHARVDDTVSMTFGSAIGMSPVAVSGEATASCDSGGGSAETNAIYAFGDTCFIEGVGKIQLDMPGSNNEIWGGMKSNLNIWIGGNNNDLGAGNGNPPEDHVTYISEFGDKVEEQDFDAGYPLQIGTPSAVPDWIHIEDYAPSGRAANIASAAGEYFSFTRKVLAEDITSDGLYYTTDEMDIADSNIDWDVTLVAQGSIKISGSNQTLDPYIDGILMFGAVPYTGIDQCDKFVIAMSGSGNSWTGLIYSPHGLIEFDGSDNTALLGSLLGYSVRVNGSNIRIHANPDLFPKGDGGAPQLLE
jgi:Flp pilus assembly protein TadG